MLKQLKNSIRWYFQQRQINKEQKALRPANDLARDEHFKRVSFLKPYN